MVIRIEHLFHDHAGERALRDFNVQIGEGDLFGIIGADGAGKSTLFRILATLLQPQQGLVQILGMDPVLQRKNIRQKIGYMPQRFSLYQDLTVLENLHFAADVMEVRSQEKKDRIEALMRFSRLGSAHARKAGQLSGGMKQKLALCCALVRKPSLLILDEPTVGVDPVTRKDFWDMLAELRRDGTTILVSTPYMDEAEQCSQVLLLHEGFSLDQGSPAGLCSRLPGKLWKIHGNSSLHVDSDCKIANSLLDLYTMGGDLHAIAAMGTEPADILSEVQKIAPDAQYIDPVAPRVEDVFLHDLRSRRSSHV